MSVEVAVAPFATRVPHAWPASEDLLGGPTLSFAKVAWEFNQVWGRPVMTPRYLPQSDTKTQITSWGVKSADEGIV